MTNCHLNAPHHLMSPGCNGNIIKVLNASAVALAVVVCAQSSLGRLFSYHVFVDNCSNSITHDWYTVYLYTHKGSSWFE